MLPLISVALTGVIALGGAQMVRLRQRPSQSLIFRFIEGQSVSTPTAQPNAILPKLLLAQDA